MAELFQGTTEHRIAADGAEIFARVGGKGPPLLLVHGFPQTHAMWHALYPQLSRRFTCVMPDLRGYGRSSCPVNDPDNRAYSKRAMAADLVSVMAALGHERYKVLGHDRGARASYRLALDHPQHVERLVLLDIVPTLAMWSNMGRKLAIKAYHWPMLAQPYPLPEMLIAPSAEKWLDYTIASWTKAKTIGNFHPEAMADYRFSFSRPDYLHAACNDYRAGATCDLTDDEADRAAGRRIACPTLAVWGDGGFPGEAASPVEAWRLFCDDIDGKGIDAGHFVAEENPQATLDAILPFLRG